MRSLIMALLLSVSTFAGYSVNTHIVEIEDNGDKKNLDVLVSYDGRIFKVDREDTKTIEALKVAREVGSQVEVDLATNFVSNKILNEIETIESVKLVSQNSSVSYESETVLNPISPLNNYIPTDLGTYEKAEKIFNTLSSAGKRQRKSQCFNRAYVWSKHMNKRFGVKSLKVLIYYSKRYRKEIRGSRWWFHIAPVVKAGSELYAMDREFLRKPYTVKEWQNYFTKKIPNEEYDCKMITHYSEFKNDYRNYSEWCFTQLTSMYYWEPNDIQRVEQEGKEMTSFSNRILKIATKEAFRRSTSVYDTLKD